MFDYAINALDSSELHRLHPPTADRNGGKRPCESGCEHTPWLQEGHLERVMVVPQDEVAGSVSDLFVEEDELDQWRIRWETRRARGDIMKRLDAGCFPRT